MRIISVKLQIDFLLCSGELFLTMKFRKEKKNITEQTDRKGERREKERCSILH